MERVDNIKALVYAWIDKLYEFTHEDYLKRTQKAKK